MPYFYINKGIARIIIVFEQERTRHFANRVPDMSYLIYDEQLLDLEGYLSALEKYIRFFYNRFLKE